MKTNTIAKLLHITPAQVEDLHMCIYLEWVGRMAKELGYKPQALAANTAISKWFSEELERLQYNAYQTLHPRYGQMDADKAQMIYRAEIADIYKSYPKTLFEAAARLKIENTLPYDHNRN